MRVRNRKGATELLEANPQYVVLNPLEAKGKWRDLFGNDHPIHVEVGSGKGAFVSGMAKQNPDINYIGIDIQKSVLSYALDKVLAVSYTHLDVYKRQVKIPAGVETGQQIRLAGQGEAGFNGGPYGDLYVVVSVESSDKFEREGTTIFYKLNLNIVQAALGDTVEIPTVHGLSLIHI